MKHTFKTRMSSKHAKALRLYDELITEGTPPTLAVRMTADKVKYSEARIWQLLREREPKPKKVTVKRVPKETNPDGSIRRSFRDMGDAADDAYESSRDNS